MTLDQCPTGCGRTVRRGHLMCGACWSAVPRPLQRDVYRTWRAYNACSIPTNDDERETFRVRREAYKQARDAAIGAAA